MDCVPERTIKERIESKYHLSFSLVGYTFEPVMQVKDLAFLNLCSDSSRRTCQYRMLVHSVGVQLHHTFDNVFCVGAPRGNFLEILDVSFCCAQVV